MIAWYTRILGASALLVGLLVLAMVWPQLSAPTGTGTPVAGMRQNEGERRIEVLRQMTSAYVALGKDVSPGMRSGKDLAPAAFLNGELERQGAKWRVGAVQGPEAELFDVS